MYKLIQIKALPNYRLWVKFSDGVEGEADLSHLAGKGVFSLWNDYSAFEKVYIGKSGQIAWTDEIDICPDTIYMTITGKTQPTLPIWWYLFLFLALAGGALLLYLNPSEPSWVDKVTPKVRKEDWSTLLAIYLLSIVLSHVAIFLALLLTRYLFVLNGPLQRKNLWPPALLGVCEGVLYPTAFLVGHAEFIGFWLLLKVAGQWPRWGLDSSQQKRPDDDSLHEGRRRYYQFLIGNALAVLAGVGTYASMKIWVLQ